ncbi:GntR family transcriptional regulator [Streptacidiphilus jiangxiensis]|uniref:DNA-binding transcriptional regulator, GntR family n=1 Tax=Streptacidiphilus jiangxiensis TaxID=235985 RepID=A0A1H7U487_STRJI|nr:GntR family transcriptional regulator [Streptacidiphilus jiangxiensis]SEL91579.1 DNA-binding transcriptional regulator, GntR family [Streptacidiphilus jiangxiensis]
MGTTATESVPEPKYWQLRTVLVRTIEQEFHTGEVLPNERDLAARFGVARATLRQALDQLELEGRLVRRRGIGTLIAAPRMGVPVAEASARDTWRIVDCGTVPATAGVAAALGVEAGVEVHSVRRVRMMAGTAVGTETLYVPVEIMPHVPGFLAESSRARAMLKQFQALPIEGESRAVELGVAEEEQARLLERPPGIPVLVLTTRYAGEDGILAAAVSTYRADNCKLTFGEAGVEVRAAS